MELMQCCYKIIDLLPYYVKSIYDVSEIALFKESYILSFEVQF